MHCRFVAAAVLSAALTAMHLSQGRIHAASELTSVQAELASQQNRGFQASQRHRLFVVVLICHRLFVVVVLFCHRLFVVVVVLIC